MSFFDDIGRAIGSAVNGIGKAVGEITKGIGEAASTVSKFIKGAADAVTDFVSNSEVGKALKLIPGVDLLMSGIATASSAISSASETIDNFATTATQFFGELAQNPANGVSSTGVAASAAVASRIGATGELARMATALGPTRASQNPAARLGLVNYAQVLAHRHAQIAAHNCWGRHAPVATQSQTGDTVKVPRRHVMNCQPPENLPPVTIDWRHMK